MDEEFVCLNCKEKGIDSKIEIKKTENGRISGFTYKQVVDGECAKCKYRIYYAID